MNKAFFSGCVAKETVFRDGGKKPVCYVRLIDNEYAGKDEQTGESLERATTLDFTVFDKLAKTIHDHAMIGDQLIVEYHIANNNRDDGDGGTEYGHSFIIDSFEFGAPGKAKREKLSKSK